MSLHINCIRKYVRSLFPQGVDLDSVLAFSKVALDSCHHKMPTFLFLYPCFKFSQHC